MRIVRLLFVSHLIALVFVLGGLLIALPHPELWADSQFGADVFTFGMRYAGSLHILLGAATMLAFGFVFIRARKTLIFFTVTVALSLTTELIGTGTGWPFGNYAYTGGLGYKVFGRVPYTIPLSWFYIGFASYLLADLFASSRGLRHRAIWSVGIGAYLLTVWDLVLDPAMAHESMPIQFWVWYQSGPYFGMPVKNFIGWAVTGVLFMSVSRLLWREGPQGSSYPGWLLFGIYLANMVFAIALSLSVGLWEPALAAVILGIVPAGLAARSHPPVMTKKTRPQRRKTRESSPSETVARNLIAASARVISSRKMDLTVDGLENIPPRGPVVLACRHYHHLLDGCALLSTIDRPISFLVALDWVKGRAGRAIMEWACRTAGWPVVLRPDNLRRQRSGQSRGSGFQVNEARHYLRSAIEESVQLLRSGQVLVMFPEAYANIDPSYTPKAESDDFLPFRPGVIRLVEYAQRDGQTTVPIVPVGFSYSNESRNVTMRVGLPMYVDGRRDRAQVIRSIEEQVRRLSQPVELPSVVPQEATT